MLNRQELLLEVKQLATGLRDGQYLRVQCPSCMDAERSMSITRTGQRLLFKCFRNKCGVRGIIPLIDSPWEQDIILSEPSKPPPPAAELSALPIGYERYLPVYPLSVEPKWDLTRVW